MTDSPFQRQIAPPAKNASRHRALAAVTRPDILTVVGFCLIGLLLTLNAMLRFPELGAMIAQYNQF